MSFFGSLYEIILKIPSDQIAKVNVLRLLRLQWTETGTKHRTFSLRVNRSNRVLEYFYNYLPVSRQVRLAKWQIKDILGVERG